MNLRISPRHFPTWFFRSRSTLAILLLLAVALGAPSAPGTSPDPGSSAPGDAFAAQPAEQAEGWGELPWFGVFCQFPGWIYHMEHGWQYHTAKLTGAFHLYDLQLGLWGWSSNADYPWIYWHEPVHAWTWYARGGLAGARRFHHADTGEWRDEEELLQGNGGLEPTAMVLVQGGTLAMSMGTVTLPAFHIGKYEVTWGEWKTVRDWAGANGYDLAGEGAGCDDDHPVYGVNWYDVVKWCNARTERENTLNGTQMTPAYTLSGATYKSGQVIPDWNASADGYRIPGVTEWEFAARGGIHTNGYTYSGGDDLDAVGWYSGNSWETTCPLFAGKGTLPVGRKAGNELGLHDMSGNVWEWCWDGDDSFRKIRGGCWYNDASGCTVSLDGSTNPAIRIPDYGFRLARY